MKALLIAGVLAIGAVIALNGGGQSDAQNGQDSPVQVGMSHVDSALQMGLSEETHDQLAAEAAKSAVWLQGFGEGVKKHVTE
ncbi:MAG TPA: hypothetical protein VMT90_07630 [Dehalococcoidia bacterium]|nr:hypothetical protein [Dehalococcoidia bacterium]